MKRSVSVIVLVIALLCGGSFGLLASPAAEGRSRTTDDFSGAATLLKTTGNPGEFMLPEPPGFRPVHCGWESDVNGSGHPYSFITVSGAPIAYRFAPIDQINQKIELIAKLYRRLPNGALQLVQTRPWTTLTASPGVPADFNNTIGIMGMPFIADNGSKFLFGVELRWYNASDQVSGTADILYTSYISRALGYPDSPVGSSCDPFLPTTAQLNFGEGTVNQSIPFKITRFPDDPNVSIYFDGLLIGSIATTDWGEGSGNFVVPAKPMGPHTVKFYRYGRTATASFVIKPRIKIIPNVNIMRDQTVNVSLRGFKAREVVRIRWKHGSTFTEIARVTTSSTGSANINVKVPKFVPNGSTSVRGDSLNATGGHAQTNAVTVNGGPTGAAAVKAFPTPSPTKTAMPSATATSIPATATATPTPTTGPTDQPATQEPTETATVQPTETQTPVVELQPSSAPSETADGSATEGSI